MKKLFILFLVLFTGTIFSQHTYNYSISTTRFDNMRNGIYIADGVTKNNNLRWSDGKGHYIILGKFTDWTGVIFTDDSSYTGGSITSRETYLCGIESEPLPESGYKYIYNTNVIYDSLTATTLPLPVELTSFIAISFENKIELQWSTATEIDNYGFDIIRNDEKIGFVPGSGNSSSYKSYKFVDNTYLVNSIYKLKQIDINGTYVYSKPITLLNLCSFTLNQNYPNPFNPNTIISYSIPYDGLVNISIYNILGEKVIDLVNTVMPGGNHMIDFNATNLSSGIYMYKLSFDSMNIVKKMIYIR